MFVSIPILVLLSIIIQESTSETPTKKSPLGRKFQRKHDCVPKRYYPDENLKREPYRVCYYTTWARYRPPPFKMEPTDFNPHLCSHVIIAFAWIRDGQLDFHSEWDDKGIFEDLVSWREIFPHLKVLAAVGGWNFGSGPFREVVKSAQARSIFIQSSIEFMEEWSLDGLDLDWEYPDWAERENLTLLLQEFSAAFETRATETNRPRFLLTAAVPAAETRMGGYDVQGIKDYLDFINVMAYDLHGPWDKKTGHNAPMNSNDGLSVKKGVLMWVERGMPRSKVVVGMPTYGHAFKLAEPWTSDVGSTAWSGVAGTYTRTSGFFSYYEVCEFLAENGTNLHWDRLAGNVPYAVNERTWISYDNEISLTKKVEWTLEEELGGIMIWSLALDDLTGFVCQENVTYPLLRAINSALGCDPSTEEAKDKRYSLKGITELRKKRKLGNKSVRPRKKNPEPVQPIISVPETELPEPEPSLPEIPEIQPAEPLEIPTIQIPTQPPPSVISSIWQNLVAGLSPSTGGKKKEKPEEIPCDFNGQFRPGKNCSHFVRCDRGVLHNFKCPDGLAFSPLTNICLWPWEVHGCLKQLGKFWPQLVATTTTTTVPPSEISQSDEKEGNPENQVGVLGRRRIYDAGNVLDVIVPRSEPADSGSSEIGEKEMESERKLIDLSNSSSEKKL